MGETSGRRQGRVGGTGAHAVCVFCASSEGLDPQLLALASDVGAGIAKRGWGLVSGGGRQSMMGAVAAAARAGGAHTVGIIPATMVDREWADHESDELVVTSSMRDRKLIMEERSHAFLALPGGIGTLDELVEIWAAATVDLLAKPVVLLDPVGHYAGLLDWLRELDRKGFLRPGSIERLVLTTDVASALDACAPGSGA